MKKKIQTFIKNPLISGSAIMFIGTTFGNVFNFLFNLFMTRNLSVVDYGILITLLSLSTFPVLLFHSIVPTTVHFATKYITNKEISKVRELYFKLLKIIVFAGLIIIILFSIFSSQIAGFIHIQNATIFIILTGFVVLSGLLLQLNAAFLQAELAFRYSSFINFLGGFLKLLTGIAVVYAGFRVGGLLLSFILISVIVFFVSSIPLKFIYQKSKEKLSLSFKEIITYGAPATLAFLCVSSFINADIILVKHFFTPQEAGLYAGIALIGKVIFFFSAPIGTVMFPLVVKKHTLGKNVNRMLIASVGLVALPSFLITLFYFIFPEFTVLFFLKKEEYLVITEYIGLFGVFMTGYAILYILVNFYLSIKKTKVAIPVMLGSLAQIILINFFHQSFFEVILLSTMITFLLVFSLLIYYFYATKLKKN